MAECSHEGLECEHWTRRDGKYHLDAPAPLARAREGLDPTAWKPEDPEETIDARLRRLNQVAADAPENKALTVRNPWAWAIIHGGKNVENRPRPTNHRGRLYIHAGKATDDLAIYKIGAIIGDLPESYLEDVAGMVIGTVDVIGSHPASDCFKFGEPACSPWAFREPDVHHWVLANPRPLATPFPARGQLGIWTLG